MEDKIIYGGDYNPDQWLDEPEILEQDLRMMKAAHINEVTLGVFAWASLEPEEGKFTLDWLEEIVNKLYANGIKTIMATPSGARPKWLSDKYPEVLRTWEDGTKAQYGGRHNHCLTSPIYREKVRIIDTKLAERFKDNPAIIAWHISNEFSGECYCPSCQKAFRGFLKKKYGTIEKLNHEWWNAFWSHQYSSFDQIDAPSNIGEKGTNGLMIDWKRYATEECDNFIDNEVNALRDAGATQPVTINMMYDFGGYDYNEQKDHIDIISWDSYPDWGFSESDIKPALEHGLCHDSMRCYKDKPFLLMESCPSGTNWQQTHRLKRNGLLPLAAIHAVGHGADSVQYFQIRAGRGSCEKFHGAIIDHTCREDTRVFKEATKTGELLLKLADVAGSQTDAKVGLIYDRQNEWAIDMSEGPRNCGEGYLEQTQKFYNALKRNAVDVDVISEPHDFSKYKILIAPMLYSVRGDVLERIRDFVKNGGTLIATYLCAMTNENDLCFLHDTPHDLTDVLGVRLDEIDGLTDEQSNKALTVDGAMGLDKSYSCNKICELITLNGAEPFMKYGEDFYAGSPAATVNHFEKGKAYYLATDLEDDFYKKFLEKVLADANVEPLVKKLPSEIDIQSRVRDGRRYIFMENFSREDKKVKLPKGAKMIIGDESEEFPNTSAKVFTVEE